MVSSVSVSNCGWSVDRLTPPMERERGLPPPLLNTLQDPTLLANFSYKLFYRVLHCSDVEFRSEELLTPALLCHKDTTNGKKYPPWGIYYFVPKPLAAENSVVLLSFMVYQW